MKQEKSIINELCNLLHNQLNTTIALSRAYLKLQKENIKLNKKHNTKK